jgi:DNA repair protein RadA/Sms
LISARQDIALEKDTVVFGEISLSGALRPIAQAENRLKEAKKLGFNAAFAPSRMKLAGESGMKVQTVDDVGGFIAACFGEIDA